MKYFLLFLLFVCLSVTNCFSQCVTSTSFAHLDINNINAEINNAGLLWDSTDANGGLVATAGYIAPKGGNVKAIFAGGLWIGGIDDAGQMHLAASTYRQNGNDFAVGPLNYSGSFNFDTVWAVYRTTIDSFIAGQFSSIPPSIKYWPAQGNPNLPSLPNKSLAPFVDVNNNGIYDPANGDYPNVKGDEATWEVFNDGCSPHGESGGLPLDIEVHLMAYAYKDTGCLNNTTFYQYDITGTGTYDSTYIGIYADPDLGCYLDDYIGCIPSLNMGVCYNGQAVDGANACANGFPNYGKYPPILGIQMTNLPLNEYGDTMHMESFISTAGVYSTTGNNPATTSCYYNLMRATWCDSTHLTYYGAGHGGTTNYNYEFPSDPTDANSSAWSECHDTINGGSELYGDVRFVMGFGPFRFQAADTVHSYTFAVLFDNDTNAIVYPCPSFSSLTSMANCVKESIATGINIPATEKLTINFYPNPMGDAGTFSFKPNTIKEIKLYTILGEQVRDYTGINGTTLQLQRGNLSAGIYFYSVIGKNGMVGNGKIVVQ